MGDIFGLGKIGAAGIAAAADTVNSNLTNVANYKIADKTNKTQQEIAAANNQTQILTNQLNNNFNAREAQKGRDFQLEMWEKENEYNSPAAQMERFKEAGLNPAVMMSQGGTSVASSVPSTQTASAAGGLPFSMPNLVAPRLETPQIGQAMANIFQALTQGDKNEAESGRITAETQQMREAMGDYLRGIKSDADRKEIENLWLPLLNDSQVRKSSSEVFANYQRALLAIEEKDLTKANTALTKAREITEKYNSEVARITANTCEDKIRAEIKNIQSQSNLNFAHANEIQKLLPYKIKGQAYTNLLIERQADVTWQEIREKSNSADKLAYEALKAYEEYNHLKLDNEVFEDTKYWIAKSIRASAKTNIINEYNPCTYVGQLLGPAAGATAFKLAK